MKGTLFSSDFAVDGSDNLRLLEINTDTGFTSASFQHFDFTPLYNTWNSHSIAELHVIYKDHQKEFVDFFSGSVASGYTGSISFDYHIEESNTIYPYTIADAADKFILRLAYDEAAILDSTYAKNNLNLLDLFYDNNDTGSIATYYHSGSEGEVDILERRFNSSTMPDVVIKDTTTTMYQPLKFYKIGHSTSGSADRFTNFINEIKDENTLIQNYYENSSNGRASSTRVYSVVYGANLDLATLAYTQTEAVLEKPTSIEATDADLAYHLGNHHYFEFATNTPVFGVGTDYGGILEEEEIVSASGDTVSIVSASVGGKFKSYFISGSPDTDLAIEYLDWSFPGSELPSGSYITSSTMINNVRQPLPYGIIFNMTPSGSNPIRISGASAILVHESSTDTLKYETLVDVDPAKHSLLSISGSLVPITSNEAEVLSGSYHVHVLDLEETDTFFLADENTHLKIVSHNCFPAGTLITMADGSTKPIEEIKAGDRVSSMDIESSEKGESTVGSVKSSQVDKLIKVTFGDGELISTPLHRICVGVEGWTTIQNVEVGDTIVSNTGDELVVETIEVIEEETTVYRLDDVADSYNYFANGALVHNWKCFTYDSLVEMFDGTLKPIGEIVKGDEVKSFKNGEYVKGIVTNALIHPTEAVVDVCKFENMIAEPHHPVMVDGKWSTFDKIAEVEQMYISNWYNLEVDGHDVEGSEHNFIVDGFIVSGLGDNDVLNSVYNRQNLKLKTVS